MKFSLLKELLSRVGFLISPRLVHYLSGLLNYLSVGRWFHDRKLDIPARCAGREALYDYLAKSIVEPASYLEFGVFKGVTLRHWTTLLKNPETRFDGFDSFIGLPESWGYFCDKKLFDVQGQMPKYDDTRVHLHKGWFTETLPGFLTKFQPRPTLILHLDADLYSSTIFVLRQTRPWLRVGTILIFDEFFDREHEMKALTEFMQDEGMRIKCLATTRTLSQAAFQITALPPAQTLPPQAHGHPS